MVLQEIGQQPPEREDIAERSPDERLGWRTFRPPPPLGLLFGAVYGALVGMVVAYDIAVLIRFGRLVQARIRERRRAHEAA
jgi:hypothetical protein